MKNSSFEEIKQLHQAGHLTEAKRGYQHLLAKNSQDITVLHWLGILYAEEGDITQAVATLQKAYQLNPHDTTIALHYANVLKAQHAYPEAIAVLQTLLAVTPKFPAIYNNLGTVYFAQGEYVAAIEAYQKAIELQTNYIDAYYNLGLAFNKLKKSTEAMRAFEAVLALSEDHPGARFQLGILLMQQQQYEKALQLFKQVLAVYPYHVESQLNLATCYIKLGKLLEAKENYLKTLELNPSDTQTLFNLGVLAMQTGRLEEAIYYYLQTAKLESNNFDAHNNLGYAYLLLRDRKNALLHFNEALRLQPNNVAIQHTVHILAQDKPLTESPKEYIQSLFDSYADHYDAHLVQLLHYQVPQVFYRIMQDKISDKKLSILDLGCGTGLCGETFKSMASSLTGVDISENMLAIAKEKNIYDHLVQSDLMDFLKNQNKTYDLIMAGDVLVYFGDLASLFSAIYQALQKDGFFIFNVEMNTEKNYRMAASGRFEHSKEYIAALAQQYHFTITRDEAAELRTQDQLPVDARVYVLKK